MSTLARESSSSRGSGGIAWRSPPAPYIHTSTNVFRGFFLLEISPLPLLVTEGNVRAALESDLSATAKRVVRLAGHWSVVGVVSADEETGEAVLSLRGQRVVNGERLRFVVLFVDGSVEGAWWLTRAHRATVKGYREVEHVTKVNGYTYNIGKKLEHDPERDEVVEWKGERATFVKLPALSALVGVASRGVQGLLEVGTLDSIVTY